MEDFVPMTIIIGIMCLFIFVTGTFVNLYFTAIDLNNSLFLASKRVELDGGLGESTTTLINNLLDRSRIDTTKLTVTGSSPGHAWGEDIYVKLEYQHDVLSLSDGGYEIITIPIKMVRVLNSEFRPE